MWPPGGTSSLLNGPVKHGQVKRGQVRDLEHQTPRTAEHLKIQGPHVQVDSPTWTANVHKAVAKTSNNQLTGSLLYILLGSIGLDMLLK